VSNETVRKIDSSMYRDDRIAVLMGGASAEREVSLRSGKAVLNALLSRGVNATGIDVDDSLVERLRAEGITRVFNVLHGRGGEDGQLQGLLSMLGIPCTGSGVLGSALAMDKVKSKQLWQGLGLSTPAFHLLDEYADWEAIAADCGELVVKPVHEGSSLGMTMVSGPEELKAAWEKARQFDARVMAEKRIRGREFTVCILHGEALPAIELGTDREFFDFEAKYIRDDTRYYCPADISDSEWNDLRQLSLAAFNALDCSGWGRVDVMRDEQGRFYLLEVNTAPGMTDHSLIPIAAEQLGMDFAELVLNILYGGNV